MSSLTLSPSLESLASSAPSTSDDHFDFKHPYVGSESAQHSTPTGPAENQPATAQEELDFDEWAEFNKWKRQRMGLQAPGTPKATEMPFVPGPQEHPRFFVPAKDIFFLVANTLYCIPRAPFEHHSEAFIGKGVTREDPLLLEGVSLSHFDHFLSILHPTEYGVYTATTFDEWAAILQLANKWGFQSIRALAIKQLAPIITDVDKIALGRKYAIDQWLGEAYYALCMREQSLTQEEGKKMVVADIIEIGALRQQFGIVAQPEVDPSLLTQELCKLFGPMEFDLPPAGTSCIACISAVCSQCKAAILADLVERPNGVASETPAGLPPKTRAINTLAAATKRAERAERMVAAARALDEYFSTDVYRSHGHYYQNELSNARLTILRENGRQELLDYIDSYNVDKSKLS